jgi:cation diffusion facilitator CzcD-associated flavoprotein CzcO
MALARTHATAAAPHVMRRRKVAVIGAGISGLAAAKCLLEEGLFPVVYEKAAQSGGLWADVGAGSQLYPSLRTRATFM